MERKFLLAELGYDTSEETETSLIEIAEQHRSSYDDERVELHKIETLRQAISYFTNYGFEVTEMC